MNWGMYGRALHPLLVCWGLTLSMVATGLGVILHHQYTAEKTLAETIKDWRDAQQKSLQYADYHPDLSRYFAHRSTWQKAGFTQPPNIDEWASNWVKIQQQFSLPHLEYGIQPSLSCAAAGCSQRWPFKSAPELNVVMTPVHLSWRIDHEVAVIAWLQRLRTEYAGMLLVRHCQWRLAEDAKNITAQCDLDMVNFPDAWPTSDPLQ